MKRFLAAILVFGAVVAYAVPASAQS